MSVSQFGSYLSLPHSPLHKLAQLSVWPHYNHRSAKEEEADFLHSLSVSTTPTPTNCNQSFSTTTSPAGRSPGDSGIMTRSELSSTSTKFNSSNNNNGTRSDYGADTDCETHPPSDSEVHDGESSVFHAPELSTVLLKMEELNKSNEADARSVTSRTASSDSPARSVGDASSSRNGSTCQQPSPEEEDEHEIDLWTIWGNLVKSWEIEMKKRPNCVKELVRRGIPQHFRTIAWQLLAGASAIAVHESYTEYLRHSSVYEKVIQRDMCRTYPELEFFKDGQRGQQSLFNVIKAYSVHDREVGYCQGSAFIVGLLLLQMPEEEAFAVFVKLMEQYRLRELYKPAMTELGLCMFQLECIVQEQMPDLYTHFNNMGFDTSMYASSWFLTLFTTSLPLELANRIMDLFLVDGMSAIFRVAIAILQQSRIDLLKLDMEGMLKYFQREIRERYENDHELLFAVASQITLNAKKMKKLEKEYLAKRTKEQEEAIELRRLRTENRLLRQRIDYLEHESSALADRLIRGQVDLATQAENSITISHELHTLRDINSDAHRRLEEAYETIRELSSKRDGESLFNEIGIQVDDMSMIEHIHSLQEELIEAHNRKADLENTIRELKLRITELECANKRLKDAPPDDGVASIQEELIRVKMREAEASLSLKEMRQRLAELEQHWSKYANQRPSISSNGNGSSASMDGTTINDGTNSPQVTSPQHSPPLNNNQQPPPQQNGTTTTVAKGRFAKLTALIGAAAGGGSEDHDQQSIRELEEQLMGLRIKEADAVAELKEMRQKVMELETQNHVVTNQLKRQDEELKRIREEKEMATLNEQKTATLLKEEQRKLLETQGEMKEASVMQRLKYTESLQQIADLKQNIAQLESKIAERAAAAQLRGGSIISDMDDDFSHRSGSYGDSNSIGSEEMSAFIADVTTKIPADFLNDGEITPVSVSEDSAIVEVKPAPVTAGGDH